MTPQTTSQALFVDFSDVWLAYNEEFLAKKQFAVEAIDLQVRQGGIHCHRRSFWLR